MDVKGGSVLEPGGFFGNYHIVRRLGAGGMGEVFLMDAPERGEQYAVKVLDPAASGLDPEDVRRFVMEAEVAMKSRHPNLVQVYDAGRDPETGLCYIVMEYMPCGSLRDVLKENPRGMSLAGVVSVATDVARALVYMEANGMVHRDVKPDNVLFSYDGTAKLSDLGISRFARAPGQDPRMTNAGDVVGTPAYMAPEQMLDSRSVDSRADVYSLGVMAFEMLAGRRPNYGESAMRTLAKAIEGMPFPDVRTLRPDTPDGLAALVSAMTMPSPAQRPSSVRATLDLLTHPERIPTALPSAKLTPPPRPAVPWYDDRSVLYAAVAMVLAFCALVVALRNSIGGP